MSVGSTIVIFTLIGTLGARQPDIDINRIRLIPREESNYRYSPRNTHIRRSIYYNQNRHNDYDDHSSWLSKLQAPRQILYNTEKDTTAKTLKLHKSRQDPRLFYQSGAYVQKINSAKMNREVASIYPGINVVEASELYPRSMPYRLRERDINNMIQGSGSCIKCPHDRTLIAKPGYDRVMLQYPRLLTCSGFRASMDTEFVHMYGPKFGSLLGQGSHIVVGRITHKNKILQTCKMQIHVLIQSCPMPKYLISHCEDQNKTCNFACRDAKAELHGQTSLTCGDDMKWSGQLPVCRARTWCEPLPIPDQGRISCKGNTAGSGAGLAEGSICRVKCAKGWRWSSRAATVCRRGAWTNALTCQQKRSK